MPLRFATVARLAAAAVFVVGAGLLIAGSMGTATPLIVAGVICVIAGGAMGFMSAFESGRYHSVATPLTQQPPQTNPISDE